MLISVSRLERITQYGGNEGTGPLRQRFQLHEYDDHEVLPEPLAQRIISELLGPHIDTQVDAAAALLDTALPGWREQVSKPVQIFSSELCVLGQLYGSFRQGADALDLDRAPFDTQEAFCPAFLEVAVRVESSWHRHLTSV